jgi:HEAT repeat protein
LLVFCVHEGRSGEEQTVVTKAEVKRLLPTGPDMMDDTIMANYKQLVDLGPAAYHALSELLDESEDPIIISRIFSVFVESQGDKTNAVSAIKKTLERFSGQEKENIKIQVAALDALGSIGSTKDSAVLYKLIDSENERVRINAMRAIGRIGDVSSIEKIEEYLARRAIRLSENEKKKDYSFSEGQKAMEKIRVRLKNAKERKHEGVEAP